MIIKKFWNLYINVNNVWYVYNFLWNSNFSMEDIENFLVYLENNNLYSEIAILNNGWVKDYYVTIFSWFPGQSNNDYRKDMWSFNNRIVQIKPQNTYINNLSLFNGNVKIADDFSIFHLKDNSYISYVRRELKKEWFSNLEKEKIALNVLQKQLPDFLKKIWANENNYRDFMLQQYYLSKINITWEVIDREDYNKEKWFYVWNKDFLFPFYFLWKRRQTKEEFQQLDYNRIVNFLDWEVWWKYFDKYFMKVSFKNTNKVAFRWDNVSIQNHITQFSGIKQISDSGEHIYPLELTFSLYLFTKTVDLWGFIEKFNSLFENDISLHMFQENVNNNEIILWHNDFDNVRWFWHKGNIKNILWTMREYIKPDYTGYYFWKEYFSNNDFAFNPFRAVWIDDQWNLLWNVNWLITWKSWSWKTRNVIEYFTSSSDKIQTIVFDNVWNFELANIPWAKVLAFWEKFPNIIGFITKDNLSQKIILLQDTFTLWKNFDETTSERIKWVISKFMREKIWNQFLFSDFKVYVKSLDKEEYSDIYNLMLSILDNIDYMLEQSLNNTENFSDILKNEAKIILSFNYIEKISNPTEKSIMVAHLFNGVMSYLVDKKFQWSPFDGTMLYVDEFRTYKWNEMAIVQRKVMTLIQICRNYKAGTCLISQEFDDFWWDVFWNYIYLNTNLKTFLDIDNYNQYISYLKWRWDKDIIKILESWDTAVDVIKKNITEQIWKRNEAEKNWTQKEIDKARRDFYKEKFVCFTLKNETVFKVFYIKPDFNREKKENSL